MNVKDIDSYRFSSMEDPSDEMLQQIMREAAQDARQRWEEANKRFFESLNKDILENRRLRA